MKKFILAFTAILSIGMAAAFANYTMTQGAGTTFGSVIVGGFHYVQMFVCDLTTPAQCQTVSAAGAAKVDGSAVTQPVSGTVTANIGTVATLSTAANQTSQITQETATAAALGTTADAACATDNGTCTVAALIKRTNQNVTTLNTTAGAAVPAGTNLIGKVGIDQTTPGTTNNVAVSYGSVPLVADPCKTAAKSSLPITLTTSAVKVIATGVSAKKIYVCQLFLTSGAADNVAIFEATTATVCATSPVAVIGAGTSVATAANGLQFTANGGVSLGNGDSQIAQTTVNNNDLCVGTSAATPLSGVITYVTQ